MVKSAIGGEVVSRQDFIDTTDGVAPSIGLFDTRMVRVGAKTGIPCMGFDTISHNADLVLRPQKSAIDAFDLRRVRASTARYDEVE